MLNLPPHPITLQLPDGSRVTYAPSGTVARVTADYGPAGTVAGVPVVQRILGAITGLPDRDARRAAGGCIVSSLVLGALSSDCGDVYAPDTGQTAVRDDAGNVVAVTRLVCP
jgi:hypothetical protein